MGAEKPTVPSFKAVSLRIVVGKAWGTVPRGCGHDVRLSGSGPNHLRTVRRNSTISDRAATCHGQQRIPTNPKSKIASFGPFFWPRHVMDAADALTSREHHNDCENHFIVSDGGDVAKADGAEPGKDKVQGGAVAALWMERGHVT